MIENPDRYIDSFIRAGVNWLSVHVEADTHINRTLQHLRANGGGPESRLTRHPLVHWTKSFLGGFHPAHDSESGFRGSEIYSLFVKKIRHLRDSIVLNRYPVRIEVDGGIDSGNLKDVLTAGAEIIVAGSAIFSSEKGASEAVREMKGIAERQIKNQHLV